MCTAVTGKGKVSKNLWFQNTTYPHFLLPGENGSISFSWLANYQLFLLCKKEGIDIPGRENDFLVKILAGKSP